MKIKTIIVDNNENSLAELSSILSGDRQIMLIGQASDGLMAVDLIKKTEPDVVLMDLILPTMDGLEVMQEINDCRELTKKPAFIILSAIGNSRIVQQATSLGAVYYIMKPFEKKLLIKRVHQVIYSPAGRFTGEDSKLEYSRLNEMNDLESTVTAYLHDLGVPAHIKGYQYLRDAIILAVENPDMINNITKVLYPMVARMNNTLPSRVERAMRHAVDAACRRGNVLMFDEMFSYTVEDPSGKPTNAEFIALIADRIRIARKMNVDSKEK